MNTFLLYSLKKKKRKTKFKEQHDLNKENDQFWAWLSDQQKIVSFF